MYWIESQEFSDGGFSIESADLNGNNRRIVYSDTESDSTPEKLTVCKDFISWGHTIETFIWQLPKNPSKARDLKPNKIAMNATIFSCVSHDIAANYEIEERTKRVPKCNALLSLLPDYHVCLKASAFCIHGTKVVGESRCDCIQGYIGERCDVSVCENYCLLGDCNVSAEGQPTCRCNAGHTGTRWNFCFQGDCIVSAKGQPECRCNAGYSGTRCEVSACHKHCLNNGVCFLNEENEPVCECTGQYDGERCDVLTTLKAGPTSDVDDRAQTDMNQTMETTTTSNTDVENNTNFTTTTDTPTTPQENIESTTYTSSVVPTSPTSDVDDRAQTNINQIMEITTTTNYFTTMTDTPTTPQENIESTTYTSSVVPTTSIQTPYERFHWLPLVDGKLPPNAIVGGFEDGNAIYMARTRHSGSLCPGKYVESTGIAYFPWGGQEYIKRKFEILCGHNPKWVKADYDNIPKNAFVGGTSERNSEPLYICRDKIDDRLMCGKFDGYYKKCYLPYKGEEKEVYSYEILVEE